MSPSSSLSSTISSRTWRWRRSDIQIWRQPSRRRSKKPILSIILRGQLSWSSCTRLNEFVTESWCSGRAEPEKQLAFTCSWRHWLLLESLTKKWGSIQRWKTLFMIMVSCRKGEGEGYIGDKKERKKERKRVVILYFMIVSHFFHGRPSQLVRCLVGWMLQRMIGLMESFLHCGEKRWRWRRQITFGSFLTDPLIHYGLKTWTPFW